MCKIIREKVSKMEKLGDDRSRVIGSAIDVRRIVEVMQILENPQGRDPEDCLKFFEAFFREHPLGGFPDKRDEILGRLTQMMQTPEMCAFGVMSFYVIVCGDGVQLPEDVLIPTIALLKDLLEKTTDPLVIQGILKIILSLCQKNIALVRAQLDILYWCNAVRNTQTLDILCLLLRILTRYLKEMKTKGVIVNQEVSARVTEILDVLLGSISPDNIEELKAVFECCWAFASANRCWITFFQHRGILEKLHYGLAMKSATIKKNTLLMMAEVYKDGRGVDKFDIMQALALVNHQSGAVQSAAVACIERYLQSPHTARLAMLIENGLVQRVIEGLHNGPYNTRHHFAILASDILEKCQEAAGPLLDGGIIECVLSLLDNTTKKQVITRLIHILQLTKRFCVSHNSAPQFYQQFFDNNGYEILEKVSENGDPEITEDADIFLKEMEQIAPQ